MNRLRVVLAEDQADMAALLGRLLAAEYEVVGTVRDGDALIRAADTLRPDAIVSDIRMCGLDGLEASRAILAMHPGARLVIVSVRDEPAIVRSALLLGALGYVLKQDVGDELVPAVRASLAGSTYVSRGAVAALGDPVG